VEIFFFEMSATLKKFNSAACGYNIGLRVLRLLVLFQWVDKVFGNGD